MACAGRAPFGVCPSVCTCPLRCTLEQPPSPSCASASLHSGCRGVQGRRDTSLPSPGQVTAAQGGTSLTFL